LLEFLKVFIFMASYKSIISIQEAEFSNKSFTYLIQSRYNIYK